MAVLLLQAQPGDFLSKVADAAVIKVRQLLLDNNSTLKDLDQALSGATLLLCDPDPSSVSTNTARKATTPTPAISSAAANASATAAGLSPSPLPSPVGGYVPSTLPFTGPAAVAVPPELPPPSQARPGRARPAVATPAEEAAGELVVCCPPPHQQCPDTTAAVECLLLAQVAASPVPENHHATHLCSDLCTGALGIWLCISTITPSFTELGNRRASCNHHSTPQYVSIMHAMGRAVPPARPSNDAAS